MLPLQPAPLLSSALEFGPVPPECLPHLERLLAVVLPLQLVLAAGSAALSPLVSEIPVAPCWHLSRNPVEPRREV